MRMLFLAGLFFMPSVVAFAEEAVVQDVPAVVVEDPCAAYMDSYDSYAACQDRVQKLRRMEDARARRAAGRAVKQDAGVAEKK